MFFCVTNYHHPEDTWPIVWCLLMHDKINQHPIFSPDLNFSKYFFLCPALGTCCCGPDNVTNSVILSPADSLWLPISAAATKTAPNESQGTQFRLLTSQRHLQSQTKDEETQGANSIDHWFVKQPSVSVHVLGTWTMCVLLSTFLKHSIIVNSNG